MDGEECYGRLAREPQPQRYVNKEAAVRSDRSREIVEPARVRRTSAKSFLSVRKRKNEATGERSAFASANATIEAVCVLNVFRSYSRATRAFRQTHERLIRGHTCSVVALTSDRRGALA